MIWNFLKRQRKPAYPAEDEAPSAKALAATQVPRTRLRDATLVITHAEVCDRHGTGALLGKIFENEHALVVFYSRNIFNHQSRGTVTHHVPHQGGSWGAEAELEVAERKVATLLDDHEVKRILCVPFFPDDALSAIAAAKVTSAPLVTYIMDDQNLFFQGIADPLMKMLLERSAMRFAISEALRSGFEEKYGLPVWIIPPANCRRWFAPSDFPSPNNQPPKGVIIGNVWSPEILEEVRGLIKASGLTVEWFGNAGKPFIQLDAAELAKEGLILHGIVPGRSARTRTSTVRLRNPTEWKPERHTGTRLVVSGQPSIQADLPDDHRAPADRGFGRPQNRSRPIRYPTRAGCRFSVQKPRIQGSNIRRHESENGRADPAESGRAGPDVCQRADQRLDLALG